MDKYFCTLTERGRVKLSQAALLQQQLQLTRMAVGDGNPLEAPPTGDETALVHLTYAADLNALYAPDEDNSVVIAEMAVPVTVGGWFVNEVAIEDADGEVIAIGNYPSVWKPEYTSGTGRVLYIRLMLDVENADNVQLQIDPAAVLASQQYVSNKISALEQSTQTALDEAREALEGQLQEFEEETSNLLADKLDRDNALKAGFIEGDAARPYLQCEDEDETVVPLARAVDLRNALQLIYRVGSLYFNAADSTSPAQVLGFGTWVPIAQGRALIGAGAGTDERGEERTFAAGDSGGEFRHVQTVEELARHTHKASDGSGLDFGLVRREEEFGGVGTGDMFGIRFSDIPEVGGSEPANIMQPYLAIHIWQRTA